MPEKSDINLSVSQIKKLGKSIRGALKENNNPSNECLEKLQAYRLDHQDALRETFDYLVERSRFHFKNSLVVYRLKRIDTIIRKIGRYSSMDLSKMQDIAGCRAIVDSVNQIKKIVEDFNKSEKFELIRIDDYIENVRDTGYSCVHIIVKPVNFDRTVEIQIRTRVQHYWATLVEITDLLFGIKLKEGQDHPDLYNFHRLLAKSRDSELTKLEMQELVELEKKHELITKLTSLFKSNYYQSIRKWIKALELNENKGYLLMQIDDSLSPSFSFYDSFQVAEEEYFMRFTDNEPNMVLIHMNNPNFEKLGLAYSNYVLTSHPSLRKYLGILRILILSYKRDGDSKHKELRTYYKELLYWIKHSFNEEIDNMNGVLGKKNMLSEKYFNLIMEWRDELRERIDYISARDVEFDEKYREARPEPLLRKLFRRKDK